MEHSTSWGSSNLWISDETPGISPKRKIHGSVQKRLPSVLSYMGPVEILFMISCNMFDLYTPKHLTSHTFQALFLIKFCSHILVYHPNFIWCRVSLMDPLIMRYFFLSFSPFLCLTSIHSYQPLAPKCPQMLNIFLNITNIRVPTWHWEMNQTSEPALTPYI